MNCFIKIMLSFAVLFLVGIILFKKFDLKVSRVSREFSINYFFRDDSFYFQFLRTLGKSVTGAADINECLMVAQNITEGDFESWYQAWYARAQNVHEIAKNCDKQKHRVSAQNAYLRASEYYRAAEFYLHGNPSDRRIKEVSGKSVACFARAAQLSNLPIEPLRIAYEESFLPGYFYRSDTTGQKRPTIILQTGLDGTQEELYGYAMQAVMRGYNVLTFEGPGQGQVLREQGLPFRPDWEHVMQPVIAYLESREDVNVNNIILYGLSFGGYLAPRAASADDENKIKILIANGGMYYPLDAIVRSNKKLASSCDELIERIKKAPKIVDMSLYAVMKLSTHVRWFIEHGMYAFGAASPSEFLLKYADYTLQGRAEKIRCLTLVCDSGLESAALAGESQKLYQHLICLKEFMLFTADEGAGYHCQVGAHLRSVQRIFDWLDAQINQQISSKTGLTLDF